MVRPLQDRDFFTQIQSEKATSQVFKNSWRSSNPSNRSCSQFPAYSRRSTCNIKKAIKVAEQIYNDQVYAQINNIINDAGKIISDVNNLRNRTTNNRYQQQEKKTSATVTQRMEPNIKILDLSELQGTPVDSIVCRPNKLLIGKIDELLGHKK